ncbi:hypothetical protein HPP92_019443 [Vanilla planifolia]|uniref:Uncharacterized protein n=1 Tax=Vanilla planifolia TaxID=51239 RepID=A0A835UJB7_VANPL|nr:hypothetical protein HPP92_019443 [Vanilla planifolia]
MCYDATGSCVDGCASIPPSFSFYREVPLPRPSSSAFQRTTSRSFLPEIIVIEDPVCGGNCGADQLPKCGSGCNGNTRDSEMAEGSENGCTCNPCKCNRYIRAHKNDIKNE